MSVTGIDTQKVKENMANYLCVQRSLKMEQAEEHGGQKGTVIKGEIASLEPIFSADGDTAMLVRGYDKSHRLHRGRRAHGGSSG